MKKLIFVFLIGALGSLHAFAGGLVIVPGQSKTVYITSTQDCHIMNDVLTSKPYYIEFYVNDLPGQSYNPYRDQRVYLWLDRCPSQSYLMNLQQFEGKSLFLKVKPSSYSSTWDFDIANYKDFNELVDNLNVDPEIKPIQFSNSINYQGPDQQIVTVRTCSFDNTTQTIAYVSAAKFIIDKSENIVRYYNSQGELALTQQLDSLETAQLVGAFLKAKSCPAKVTLSHSLRRIVKVTSDCPDFSQNMLLNKPG